MTNLTDHSVTARSLQRYDGVFVAGRWRSVISADLTTPSSDEQIAELRQRVADAAGDQALMDASFALAYALQRRKRWPEPVVRVQLGTAGANYFQEYAPDDLVTVRRAENSHPRGDE